MKRILFAILGFCLLAGVCCQDESGLAKERKAIKAVIENEKVAYYKQDLTGLDNSWIQESTSRKLFMTPNGITEFNGWSEIHQNHVEETERVRTENVEPAVYSNYSINVYGNTAVVFHDSHHKISQPVDATVLKMRRILHMKKHEDAWKIDLMAMYLVPHSPMGHGAEL